jgi:hypothetical protein
LPEFFGALLSLPVVSPVKVWLIGVLVLMASSANLGLSILSPVTTILRDDFLAWADRTQLAHGTFMLSVAIN